MSAIGPKGADGINSTLAVVKATAENENVYYGIITNSANIDDISSNNPSLWNTNFENLNDGTPVIVVFDNKNNLHVYSYAFGVVKKIGDNWNAIWSKDSIINDLLTNIKITNYLKSINNTKNDTDPKYLPIPIGDGTENMHKLYGDGTGGLVLSCDKQTNKKFILDKYDVVFSDDYSSIYDTNNININSNGIVVHNGDGETEIHGDYISTTNVIIGLNSDIGTDCCAKFNNNVYVYAGISQTQNGENDLKEVNYVGMPIASVIMYAGYIPANDIQKSNIIEVGNCWLVCNGASLGTIRGKYRKLIYKIGDTLPDFRSVFPLGTGYKQHYEVNNTGGTNSHTINLVTGNNISGEKKNVGLYIDKKGPSESGFIGTSEFQNFAATYEPNSGGSAGLGTGIGMLTYTNVNIDITPPYISIHFLIKFR